MAGAHTRSEECGSIGFNAGNLTRSDGRMKVRLKVLPDKPRGGAWPTPARAVKHEAAPLIYSNGPFMLGKGV